MEHKTNYAEVIEKGLRNANLVFVKSSVDKRTKFNILMPVENSPTIPVTLIVRNDGNVMYRCYLAYDIERYKWADIILECNKLNCEYRFINLFLDADGGLCASYDFMLSGADEDIITKDIVGTVLICSKIIDECIPGLMKILRDEQLTDFNKSISKINMDQNIEHQQYEL